MCLGSGQYLFLVPNQHRQQLSLIPVAKVPKCQGISLYILKNRRGRNRKMAYKNK